MNLRAVANRATRTINPNLAAVVLKSVGYTTDAPGRQQPRYAPPVEVTIQAQSLSKKDLDHLASMNISNVTRAIYASTSLSAVDRTKGTGGDLLAFEGANWLVTAVLEEWTTAGWCKVALTRQMG